MKTRVLPTFVGVPHTINAIERPIISLANAISNEVVRVPSLGSMDESELADDCTLTIVFFILNRVRTRITLNATITAIKTNPMTP